MRTDKFKTVALFCFISILFTNCTSMNKQYLNPKASVNIVNVEKNVTFLAEIDPPRNHQNLSSLNRAADYIFGKFSEIGYSPTNQEFNVNGNSYRNIVASIGPKDSPVLVIGAHYDVCGNQPGADDNASGISGLIELARLLKNGNHDLKYRIELVAYTLEEPPFFRSEYMGSHIHALSLKERNADVFGMVSLEMIGYYTDEAKTQEYPLSLMKLFYPTTGNFIALVGNFGSISLINQFKSNFVRNQIKTKRLMAPSFIAGVDFSDHLNYWKYGYKAMMITDTAFFRNKNYHEKTDTPATLNYQKMAEVIRGIYLTIINL